MGILQWSSMTARKRKMIGALWPGQAVHVPHRANTRTQSESRRPGSSKISSQDMDQLKQLGQTAASLSGYIIEVVGHADATGSAEIDAKLSEDRAKAVVAVLIQLDGAPVRRIVAPRAMGECGGAAPNETAAGRGKNRRVEVNVLLNEGIAGN